MIVKWVKDQRVEHNLRRLGIKFDTVTVAISDIDLEESANRQVRIGKKVNDDWVVEYGAAMESGAAFPMVILQKLRHRVGGFSYFIWSGNHRTRSAVLLGDTQLDAYVVEVTDARLADILPRIVNAWEGRRLSREEMLINAEYLVKQHSVPTDDAAALFGLKKDWLVHYLRSSEVAERIRAAGVEVNGMSKSMLGKLSPISDNANVLRAVVKVIKRGDVPYDDQMSIIQDVRGQETEAKKLACVEEWENVFRKKRKPKDSKASTKVPYRQPIRQRLINQLTAMRRLVEQYDSIEKMQLVDPADQRLARGEYEAIRKRLDATLLAGKVVG